jgi:predicted Zn-dependent protease
MLEAAETAATIARTANSSRSEVLKKLPLKICILSGFIAIGEDLSSKIALLNRADAAARGFNSRIKRSVCLDSR